jgi:hypothetical protein
VIQHIAGETHIKCIGIVLELLCGRLTEVNMDASPPAQLRATESMSANIKCVNVCAEFTEPYRAMLRRNPGSGPISRQSRASTGGHKPVNDDSAIGDEGVAESHL